MVTRYNGWISMVLALSALSCGDAVPPPAEGSVSVSLTPSVNATPGKGCPSVGALTWAGNGVAPSSTSPGELLVDGEGGADVACTVKGDGTYSLSGSVKYQDNVFNISGTVNPDGTGTAYVSLWHSKLLSYIEDPNCTLTTTGASYAVKPGEIWASITCDHFVTDDDRSLWCAGTADMVFRSCED